MFLKFILPKKIKGTQSPDLAKTVLATFHCIMVIEA